MEVNPNHFLIFHYAIKRTGIMAETNNLITTWLLTWQTWWLHKWTIQHLLYAWYNWKFITTTWKDISVSRLTEALILLIRKMHKKIIQWLISILMWFISLVNRSLLYTANPKKPTLLKTRFELCFFKTFLKTSKST